MNPGSTSTSASAEKSAASEEPAASTEAVEGGDGNAEGGEPSVNLADQAGAGEEGEDTVIEQRGKLYLFENGAQAVKGLGQFKLKRAKEAEGGKTKRRLLMRVAGNGNVILVSLPSFFGLSSSTVKMKRELMVEHDHLDILQANVCWQYR